MQGSEFTTAKSWTQTLTGVGVGKKKRKEKERKEREVVKLAGVGRVARGDLASE
jgi:hypothetical protein